MNKLYRMKNLKNLKKSKIFFFPCKKTTRLIKIYDIFKLILKN